MSARPRPVTATFPPPPLISPVHFRPTSRSPSPLNSTASLLSVLDHNSYESVPSRIVHDEDDRDENYRVYQDKAAKTKANRVEEHSSQNTGPEESSQVGKNTENADNRRRVAMARTKSDALTMNADGPMPDPWTTLALMQAAGESAPAQRVTWLRSCSHLELKRSKSVEAAKQNVKSVPPADSSQNNSYETKSFEVETSFEKDMKDSSNQLSAWEHWIVRKAKEDRAKAEQELERQKKLREEEERIQKEKEKKKKDVEKVVQEWMKKYDLKKKQDTETEMLKSQEKEQLKKKEKQTVSEKAKVKYDEWVLKKAEEEAKRKKDLLEKREKEQLEKANRQKKNEEAFNEWCKKAQSRPRTAPSSYGYSDGRLTGYYDTGAYPVPSYVNPVPWRPVEIPRPKSQLKKKKPTTKRRYYTSNYV